MIFSIRVPQSECTLEYNSIHYPEGGGKEHIYNFKVKAMLLNKQACPPVIKAGQVP